MQRLLEWSLCSRRREPVLCFFYFFKGHFWDSAADGKRNNVMLRLFEDSLRSGVTWKRLFSLKAINSVAQGKRCNSIFHKSWGRVRAEWEEQNLQQNSWDQKHPVGGQSDPLSWFEEFMQLGRIKFGTDWRRKLKLISLLDGSDTTCRAVMYVKLTALNQRLDPGTHRHRFVFAELAPPIWVCQDDSSCFCGEPHLNSGGF